MPLWSDPKSEQFGPRRLPRRQAAAVSTLQAQQLAPLKVGCQRSGGIELGGVGVTASHETKAGAIVDESHTNRVLGFVDRAGQEGQIIAGGSRRTVDGRGCFIEPTIVTGLEPTAELVTEEVFGPVLAVQVFDDDAEAIAMANNTIYGRAASAWTNDLRRAHTVARALRAGTVSVNTVDALSSQTPFGGFKQSGFGRDLSLHALEKYTGIKTTWIRF
jgi:gamma-glutamyl-gamma-aminobutyraldehyde dehydrogenase